MKFIRKTLPNGLRVITIHMADNPTVTVLALVETGSNYETKAQGGISHFLEHMCFKGTERRPKASDISRELDALGSQYNAFTSQEFTGYYAKSNARHLDAVLDIVSDLYLNQTFPAAEIEKEKGVIVDEISMYEDLPHNDVHTLWAELLYGDQPAGRKITGTKETVRAMTRDSLIAYREAHYVAEATTIVVAGSFDEARLQEEIAKKFAGIRLGKKDSKEKVVEKQSEPQIALKNRKTDQAHIVLGVRAFDTYDKRTSALRVLSAVLGGGMSSRLFQKLREEMGVGYYVHASADLSSDHGVLEVSTGVDSKRVSEVIQAIIAEMSHLKNTPVPEDELARVKEYLTGNFYLGLESSDALAEFYGFQEIQHKKLLMPDEAVSKIRAVTADDIQSVAGEIFRDDRLNLAIIGPIEDRQAFLPLLKL